MACEKRYRRNITRNRLPLNHREISKLLYYRDIFRASWKFHLYLNDLHIDEMVLRRIVYDAINDALVNKNGKIHKKDFLKEYANFLHFWNTECSHLNEKIANWINYRESEEYKALLEGVKHVSRFDVRAKILVNNAMAWAYATYQGKPLESYYKIESRLLGWVEKAWSKKWLWFAATLLVFDASSLYANTVYNNDFKQIYIQKKEEELSKDWWWDWVDWEKANEEAIKITLKRWYEKEEISDEFKLTAKIYEELIVPVTSELGSVLLAEAARRGTVIALVHLANMLALIAQHHPAVKGLSWGSKLAILAAEYLNRSILAWLGWQIALEWSLDAYIQYFCKEIFELLGRKITGVKYEIRGADWGLFRMAMKYLFWEKAYGWRLEDYQKEVIEHIKQYGSEKQKRLLEKLENVILTTKTLFNIARQYSNDLKNIWKDLQFELKQYWRDKRDWRKEIIERLLLELLEKKALANTSWYNFYNYLTYKDEGRLIDLNIVKDRWNELRQLWNEVKNEVRKSEEEGCKVSSRATEVDKCLKYHKDVPDVCIKGLYMSGDVYYMKNCTERVGRFPPGGFEGGIIEDFASVWVNRRYLDDYPVTLYQLIGVYGGKASGGKIENYLVGLEEIVVDSLEKSLKMVYDLDRGDLLKVRAFLNRQGRLCLSIVRRKRRGYHVFLNVNNLIEYWQGGSENYFFAGFSEEHHVNYPKKLGKAGERYSLGVWWEDENTLTFGILFESMGLWQYWIDFYVGTETSKMIESFKIRLGDKREKKYKRRKRSKIICFGKITV